MTFSQQTSHYTDYAIPGPWS